MVEDLVARDGEEPGAEARLGGIEGGRVSRDRDSGLLVQVFGGVCVRASQQSANELKAWAVISVVEAREGVHISGAVGAEQLGVVRWVRLHQGQSSRSKAGRATAQ
jgi:hypothetical protein